MRAGSLASAIDRGWRGVAPAPGVIDRQLPELLAARWEYAVAALLVAGSVYLSKAVVWLLARPVARRVERAGLQRVTLGAVRSLTVAAAVAVAAVLVGFEPGDVLLSVTVISAVIGVVLAPVVRSVLNGTLVLLDRPFTVGDFVELETGERGFVDEITIRYTRIYTLENAYVLLSNSEIRQREITNYSADDDRTRLSLRVTVPYETDVSEARSILEKAARDCEDVIVGGPKIRVGRSRYPSAPTCYVEEFADHGVLLHLSFWTTDPGKMLTVRSKIRTRVLAAFDDAGIDIPYPHTHHVFDETSGRAKVSIDAEPEVATADGGTGSVTRGPSDGVDADRQSPDADHGSSEVDHRSSGADRRASEDEGYDPGIGERRSTDSSD